MKKQGAPHQKVFQFNLPKDKSVYQLQPRYTEAIQKIL